MADGVALAGTIGTWVAVFLAVLALAGILPVYLLIRTSRQEKNRAIAAVDDPTANFVSKGISAPLLRGFRKVKVPNLRIAPSFNLSQPQHLRYPTLKLNPSVPNITRSTTGWINFASIITTAFTELKYTSGTPALEIRNSRSFLPVHCGWLLILTVLHRYAYREDFGLPVGSPVDADLELLEPTLCLSGLSGVITTNLQSGRYETSRRDRQLDNEVRFRMHEIADLRQILQKEFIPLSNLCFLFAGLLPAPDGMLLSLKRQDPSRRSRSRGSAPVAILQLEDIRDPTSFQIRLIRLLGLKITRAKTLRAQYASSSVAQLLASASSTLTEKYLHIGRIRLTRHTSEIFNCWLSRETLYTALLVYLESPVSPQSFLYDVNDDIILKNVVRPNVFSETLRLAQRFCDRLQIQHTERETLRLHLEQTSTDDISGQTWSRTEMASLWKLDQTLSKLLRLKDLRFISMSMLYMYDQKFQEAIIEFLASDVLPPLNDVLINLERNIIRLPNARQPTEYHDFPFNFTAVFKDARAADVAMLTNNGALRELSYPLVESILACLHGHVRALMWKRCLNPKGLTKLFRRLDSGSDAYIASQTEAEMTGADRGRGRYSFSSSESDTETQDSGSRGGSESNGSFFPPPNFTLHPRRRAGSSESTDVDDDVLPPPPQRYTRRRRQPSAESSETWSDFERAVRRRTGDREGLSRTAAEDLLLRERPQRRVQVNQPETGAMATTDQTSAPTRPRSV